MKKEFHKRIDYGLKEFDIENTPENPLELFLEWLKEAEESIPDASAMVLSTVGELGIPSSRIVLLRQLDKEGIKERLPFVVGQSSRTCFGISIGINGGYWR